MERKEGEGGKEGGRERGKELKREGGREGGGSKLTTTRMWVVAVHN